MTGEKKVRRDSGLASCTRRSFLARSFAAAGAVAFQRQTFSQEDAGGPGNRKVEKVKNAIVIISDTMRRDAVECYENSWVHSDNLGEFAKRCWIFDNAYIASFPTVPMRNDVLTGTYTFTYKPWSPIDAKAVTLQQVLGRAGVVTALVVDTPHPFAPGYNYQRGYHSWELIRGQEHDPWRTSPEKVILPCDENKLRRPATVIQYLRNVADRKTEQDYFVAQTMRTAALWLERNRGSTARTGFFLYVDTFDPHEPWDPPAWYVEQYQKGYAGQDVIYPRYDRWRDFLTEEELHRCRCLYAGEATMVDTWIGFLLRKVEELGLLQDTMIIITSDHGFCLGEHGHIGKSLIRENFYQDIPLYPEISRIPFLVYHPGLKGATRVRAFVQPPDIMPTVLDCMGIPVPETVRGKSLLPLFTGRREKVRDFVISSPTISHPGMTVPRACTRSSIADGEWFLIYGAQVGPDTGAAKTEAVDSVERERADLEKGEFPPELYHLASDPGCEKNVIGDRRDAAEELHARYYDFLVEAGVPEGHRKYFRAI
jgi:arylsulfatase A-like enzyme